jgi:hypothetical protein
VIKKHITSKKFTEVKFNTKPKTQTEVSECEMELSPGELERISAGPKMIDFDKMVVRSERSKVFSVVNDLSRHIYVELNADGFEEIDCIKPSSIVIPPGKTAGFTIVFLSSKITPVSRTIGYTINGHHEFNFLINAIVEPAVLELSKPSIDFTFDDESLEESISENILIENKSNSLTTFGWHVPDNTPFVIKPMAGEIEAFTTAKAVITYTPVANVARLEEEDLVLKVDNGEPRILHVRADLPEVKCVSVQRALEFGDVCVGVREERYLTIRNISTNSRTAAVFHIKSEIPDLTITPEVGKIHNDAKQNLKCVFCSEDEVSLNQEIEISIRGGKPMQIPVTANAIIPNVYIDREEIDFGGVTCGNTSVEEFNLTNESLIDAVVYIDLREHQEFEISLGSSGVELEANILVPATIDADSPYYDRDDDDLDEAMDPGVDDEEESDEEDESLIKIHRITVPKQSSIPLCLKFTPANTEAFLFDMPMILAGINRGVKGITK